MIEMFKDELELCEIGSSSSVAVLTEGDQLRDYALGFFAAARELGANVEDVNIPSENAGDASARLKSIGSNCLASHPGALEICKSADLVVDHMLLLFSKEQHQMQDAGARVLTVVEPIDVLERLFPDVDLQLRVEAAERRLRQARELRFTNRFGTDVTFKIGQQPIMTEYGFTAIPGRWDHWPSGFLATLSNEHGVNGRVVMAPDDIIYPLKKFVQDPVEFLIRDGRVIDIRGANSAAELIGYIASYDDTRAYAVSHIGWGLNKACDWRVDVPGIGMDGRAHYGNVLFSLGPDTEFGGKNDTACHLDLPMKDCSLYLDGELIIEDGTIIPEDMRITN